MPIRLPAARWLLISMHLAGIIGLIYPMTRPLFLLLVPFNLLVTAGLLARFHSDYRLPFLFFCLLIFGAGFGVEVLGVHTGLIFGEYSYGSVLGWKQWEVPLLIGVNWLVLIYCAGIITEQLVRVTWARPFVGAGLLVVLDVFIEPVAIQYGFWQWQTPEVPLRNYVGWYITAWLLLVMFQILPFRKNNQLAYWVYGVQFLFFLSISLIWKLNF